MWSYDIQDPRCSEQGLSLHTGFLYYNSDILISFSSLPAKLDDASPTNADSGLLRGSSYIRKYRVARVRCRRVDSGKL